MKNLQFLNRVSRMNNDKLKKVLLFIIHRSSFIISKKFSLRLIVLFALQQSAVNISKVMAQDLNLSQYQYAPMHTSPALTGFAVDGTLVSAQYRSQWTPLLGDNSFRTTSANIEYRANNKSSDFWGYGAAFWSDQAGALRHTQGQLSVQYSKQLAGNDGLQHILSAGGSLGVMQRLIDLTDRRWLSQYNGNGGYDPNLQGSNSDISNRTLIDIGIGLAWHTTFKNHSFASLALAIQHLNKPDISQDKNSIFGNLYERYVLLLDSEVKLSTRTRLVSGVLMQKQGPSLEYLPQVALKTIIVADDFNDIALQLGGAVRIVNNLDAGQAVDAWVALIRMDWNKFSFGFSYDINISALRLTTNNNAVEVVCAYRMPRRKEINKLKKSPRYF